MTRMATSRRTLLLGGAAVLALSGCSSAKTAAEGDMALGAAEGAKVTVVEYASVTCHICANWQEQVWPAFKAKYVDTNQVRYVFREYPTPPVDVATAGFLIARCAGPDKYFDVVHQILASVNSWDAGTSPRDTLVQVSTAAGLSDQQFQQCITDEDAIRALDARISEAQAAGVTGTPAFFVNGAMVGDRSLAGLSAAIDAELAKA
ncbi:MAG: DsbA family protein [Alphaproteobacteria bacterium]|nr:DsbA family protein [Alphaproteobacteria bacterium]MBU1539927.1 DsbA family protein [Alphaproteobacteria bacterium]MBU2380119.1 DsbA family protein [Alphaproteobacteria bacterium]